MLLSIYLVRMILQELEGGTEGNIYDFINLNVIYL